MSKDPKKTSTEDNLAPRPGIGPTPNTASQPAPPPPGDSGKEPIKVSLVPAPADDRGVSAGPALSPRQEAGLDPVNPEQDAKEAEERFNRPNLQTSHEAANALDPVSGTPSPGITQNTPLTGIQQGQEPTDMSGRPPLSKSEKDMLPELREKLTKARSDDASNGVAEDRQGWRSAADLGIGGGVMRRIADALGNDRLEQETALNGQYFPETGTRYRIKG